MKDLNTMLKIIRQPTEIEKGELMKADSGNKKNSSKYK